MPKWKLSCHNVLFFMSIDVSSVEWKSDTSHIELQHAEFTYFASLSIGSGIERRKIAC